MLATRMTRVYQENQFGTIKYTQISRCMLYVFLNQLHSFQYTPLYLYISRELRSMYDRIQLNIRMVVVILAIAIATIASICV